MALVSDTSVEQAHFVLNSNDKFPAVGLGTWKAGTDAVRDSVLYAIVEAGYRHIDCAHIYGNEEEVGTGLQAAFDAGIKREDVFVTSKLWVTSNSPERVKPALLKTLNDLGLEYLDLYLVHWPITNAENAPQPVEEQSHVQPFDIAGTWKVLEGLVGEKLIRNIGVSNFSIPKLEILFKEATILPAVHQIEMHAGFRNEEILHHGIRNKYHVSAYSPLGSAGNDILQNPSVLEIAKKLGKTPGQVLLRWLLQLGVSVLPKSSNEKRIKENADIFGWSLSAEDVQKVGSLSHQARLNSPWDLLVPKGADKEKILSEFWDNGYNTTGYFGGIDTLQSNQ